MVLRIPENDPGGGVGRTVVHDNDFHIPAALGGVRENFIQRGRDARAFIVGREDDAIRGRFQDSAISFQLRDASVGDCAIIVKPRKTGAW